MINIRILYRLYLADKSLHTQGMINAEIKESGPKVKIYCKVYIDPERKVRNSDIIETKNKTQTEVIVVLEIGMPIPNHIKFKITPAPK